MEGAEIGAAAKRFLGRPRGRDRLFGKDTVVGMERGVVTLDALQAERGEIHR